MKKILHLIETSEPGGAESVLFSLVKKCQEDGYHSMIGLLSEGWLKDVLMKEGFQPIIIEQRNSYDWLCVMKLIRIIKDNQINLIHSHEFMMNVYGCLASKISGIPIVTTVHGKNYYGERLRRRLAYRYVSKWSEMVAVSNDLKRFLIEKIGIKSDRIKTLYNGIDIKKYEGLIDVASKKYELKIPANVPVIGMVGMLFYVKGYSYFLKAASIVTRSFPDAIFLIVGDGYLKESLKKEAYSLRIHNNVKFLGLRDDIPSLVKIMDIFVLSSLSEGLSLSILEAMASSRPVITTNVGGNPEVVDNDMTGFLVESHNPESLASKMIILVKDKDLSAKMGKAGRAKVEQQFSLERMVKNYQQLYESKLCYGTK